MEKKCYRTVKKIISMAGLLSIQLLLMCSAAFGQSVSGVVTDAVSGETLPGVNITVKGTTSGTSSGAEGDFSLSVSSLEDDTLQFSFVGYQTQEIAIDGRSEVEVAMEPEAIAGEEVVVVGYGEQESEDVTGSVGSVSLAEVEEQPMTGPDQLLTGQISGVQVNQPAGIPGGGPQIEIRGTGTIGAGGQPLYVVDGFPISNSSSVISNPLSDIATEDIESINVLKDASATAIYGSRGSNGVVLIETKSGEAGELQFQINGYTGVQQIPQKGRPDLMNAQEFAQFRKEAIGDQIRLEEGREPTEDDIPEDYRNPEQYGEGTNWFNEITRVAPMRNIDFSAAGGSEDIRARISAGYLSQEGVLKGTGFERISLRANVDANLTDKLTVDLNMAPTFTTREQGAVAGGGRGDFFGNALVASPIPSVYNEDGSYNSMISTEGTFNYPNPVMALNEVESNSRGLKGLLNGSAQYDFLESLNFKSSINVEYSSNRNKYFNPSTVGGENLAPPVPTAGSYGESSSVNWANENILTYEDEIIEGHTINALAGFTVQENTFLSADFDGDEYPDDDIETLNAASDITGGTGEESWALVSYLARVNYDFQNKYLITGTVRRDGSSRFGSENRWGLFPSGALGWRVSEEPFMDDLNWLSELKLRASYGISGNFNIGNYTHLSQVTTNDYVFGGSRAPGKGLNTMGNINLGWERSKEINFGVDFGLWEDRVTVTAEAYKRNTENLLLDLEIPQSSGFSNVSENRGDIENKGLEIAVTSRNVIKSNVNWTTNFNISFNRNEVLELGQEGDPILAGASEGNPTHITEVGQPIGMYYGWVVEGLYESESEIENSPSFPGAIPGNMKVKDVDGDGEIVPVDDFGVIGNPNPDFEWGMTNSISYGNLGLNILMTGSYGGEVLKGSNEFLHNIDGVFNVTRDVKDRWRSPDQPGNGIVPTTSGSARGRVMYRGVNSLSVKNSTHLWIKNVSLNYNLSNTLPFESLRDASVYVSIQNALLLSGYEGNPDAETYNSTTFGGPLAPGVDYSTYPVPRVISLGFQVGL